MEVEDYISLVLALDNSSHCYYDWLLINLANGDNWTKERTVLIEVFFWGWGVGGTYVYYIWNKGLLLTHLNLLKRKCNVHLHVYKYDVIKFDHTCIFVFGAWLIYGCSQYWCLTIICSSCRIRYDIWHFNALPAVYLHQIWFQSGWVKVRN